MGSAWAVACERIVEGVSVEDMSVVARSEDEGKTIDYRKPEALLA